MDALSTILWLSIGCQILAAVFALRLMTRSGRTIAWVILSVAFLLMALRRGISVLYSEGYISADPFRIELIAESVALVISACILLGVLLIGRYFESRRKSDRHLTRLSQAMEQNPISTLISRVDGTIVYANPTFLKHWGMTEEQIINRNLNILRCPETPAETIELMWETVQNGNSWHGEICRRDKHANLRYEAVTISPFSDIQRRETNLVVMFEDITEAKQQRDTLEHLALHDSLTGLPNRQLFSDRVEVGILNCNRNDQALAVLMIDLNRFKEINDTLGHHVGDQVLKEVGERLQHSIRQTDTVARMGGDEFLILLHIEDPAYCDKVAKKIHQSMDRPVEVEGYSLDVSMSIGVALYPEHGKTTGALIQKADIAMFAAKQANTEYCIYHHAHDMHSTTQLELASELRRAIENDDMVLHYQPKIDLGNNQCSGFEVLVRWQHPIRGLARPDAFIDIAERTGYIKPLTRWVIRKALQDSVTLKQQGLEYEFAINISGRYFQDTNFVDDISHLIKETGADANLLVLELTESVLMSDIDRTIDTLERLHKLGIRLSIDDFGTGYSSLEYLKRFPVAELKIDKSFVMHMLHDENDAVIVRSTIGLAHNLGMKVTGEGVENANIYDLLAGLGCDACQGYYISEPLPLTGLSNFLQTSRWAKGTDHRLSNQDQQLA
jgi:diguanylate cyclase (GGDEF)-like protein/PAS domain S-box-containing protein